ncbi:MAG: hypothetical protein WC905_01215 [Patescibacteria group bacterium]|jgi:ABC-type transport system involved in multi-copper enzyme maturation permease subunit
MKIKLFKKIAAQRLRYKVIEVDGVLSIGIFISVLAEGYSFLVSLGLALLLFLIIGGAIASAIMEKPAC